MKRDLDPYALNKTAKEFTATLHDVVDLGATVIKPARGFENSNPPLLSVNYGNGRGGLMFGLVF